MLVARYGKLGTNGQLSGLFPKLEGSPTVSAQNEKFNANMVNQISCGSTGSNSSLQELTSDAVIELVKDYEAWATGDASRQPLGTGDH